ncbi:uncharacterized protein LOC110459463 isoform X1 [Mizuhopecten yessoensis]|nr:uncharacterized protein LOC110459463 isoform X1 [Mizuhopecten yessoensis]
MDEVGEGISRVPLQAPVKKRNLGRLLVGQSHIESSGMFGTRVLSPKMGEITCTASNNNALSGGSYTTMGNGSVGVSNTRVADHSYNGIKVSSRMQLATPSPDHVYPLTFANLAQPEDDTANTQKLAIGTWRSMSVEVSGHDPYDQIYKHGKNFIRPETLGNQVQPYTPEKENVSLFLKKMQQESDTKLAFRGPNLEDTCFRFQDPEDMPDETQDLSGLIHDIDDELEKVPPGQEKEVDRKGFEDFQAVNGKPENPILEETVPALGVQVRNVGAKPVEDFSKLNIVLTSGHHQGEYQKALYKLILGVKNKSGVTPSSVFKEGRVLFGTDKACQEMLDKSEFLPSHGTHGVILYDKLRPQKGRYTEEDFSVTEVLGRGNFGEVKLCQDKTTKAKFVRKQVRTDYKKSEVEVMMSLKHQNITQFYGVVQREGDTEILMEYSGVSLLTFVLVPATKHLVTEEFIWNVNRQGLSALAHLEIYGIIHLDIKPENMCILETATGWTLKLTDFGSAKLPQDPLTYNGWTAEYMSPEASISFVKSRFPQLTLIDSEDWAITPKSDVYSWGLTVVFMYRKTHILMHAYTGGQNNYKNVDNPTQIKLLIIMSMARDPDMVRRCLIPDDCSSDMKIVMNCLLAGNPTQRHSAAEAVAAIDKISSDKLLSKADSLPELLENDLDCFIYDPSEVHSPAPGPTRVRRTSSVSSCVSSQASISSVLSYCSNASCSKPRSPNGTGKSRRRIVKKKLRDRIASPYPRTDRMEILSPSTELDGNVPDFAALG